MVDRWRLCLNCFYFFILHAFKLNSYWLKFNKHEPMYDELTFLQRFTVFTNIFLSICIKTLLTLLHPISCYYTPSSLLVLSC